MNNPMLYWMIAKFRQCKRWLFLALLCPFLTNNWFLFRIHVFSKHMCFIRLFRLFCFIIMLQLLFSFETLHTTLHLNISCILFHKSSSFESTKANICDCKMNKHELFLFSRLNEWEIVACIMYCVFMATYKFILLYKPYRELKFTTHTILLAMNHIQLDET